MLGRALTLAARSRLIENRPLLALPTVNNTRPGFVYQKTMEAILANLEEPVRSVALFGFITGWRKSEILGLTWAQVDTDTGVIRLEPGTTKNREGRVYPYRDHPRLRRLVERLELEKRGAFLFHRKGKRVKDFRGAWKTACRKASSGHTLFHDLRRTAVRNLENANVQRKVQMQLVGMRTEAIHRRYAITNQNDLSRGVRLYARGHHEREDPANTE
jgi:integrase